MKPEDYLPITEEEAEELHKLGWGKGFGGMTEFDWYWPPSSGPDHWVEDDPKTMRWFLSDLESIRATAKAEARTERLHAAAEDLLEALEMMVDEAKDIMVTNKAYDDPDGPVWEEWFALKNARAAIAKVEDKT